MSEISAGLAELLVWLLGFLLVVAAVTTVALLLYGLFFKKSE